VILIIVRFKMHLKWSISKGYYTRIDTLFTTGQIKFIIVEMVIVALCPYEFLQEADYLECNSFNTLNYIRFDNAKNWSC